MPQPTTHHEALLLRAHCTALVAICKLSAPALLFSPRCSSLLYSLEQPTGCVATGHGSFTFCWFLLHLSGSSDFCIYFPCLLGNPFCESRNTFVMGDFKLYLNPVTTSYLSCFSSYKYRCLADSSVCASHHTCDFLLCCIFPTFMCLSKRY